jgi:protein-tyrosine phosphatase
MGGGGRAGTVYAAYLIRQGMAVDAAIRQAPGVTTDAQKAFLHGLAAGLSFQRPQP